MSARATPLRAVVFDLDGTLFDSLTPLLQAIAAAVGTHGPKPTMEIFARLGGPPEVFARELVFDPQHVPIVVRRLAEFHRDHADLLRPFDGARETLLALHALGVRLAIWSGRDRVSALHLLREHGLEGLFSTMVCGDDLPTHKPAPEGMRAILRTLGLAPADVVFVGDADVDVLGGVAAGVETVLIRHARALAPELVVRCREVTAAPRDAYDLVLAWAGADAARGNRL